MKSGTNIKSYSADELLRLRPRGESKTDLQRVRAKTQADLEQDIVADEDWKDVPPDWQQEASAVMPVAKRTISILTGP